MKSYRPYAPSQPYLLPPSPSEWLPEGHLAYFILDLVEDLDLGDIERVLQAKDPRAERPYSPRMMTALWLYGYAVGVTSSRKLEKATYQDVAVRVLAAGEQPHFTSLNEFRAKHRQALANLFHQILRECVSAGLVKLGHVAIDGTKMKANASKHKAMSYERMEQEDARLTAEIEAFFDQADATDAEEDRLYGAGQQQHDLPAELRRREDRRAKIRAVREALEQETAKRRAAELQHMADELRAKAEDPTTPQRSKPASRPRRHSTTSKPRSSMMTIRRRPAPIATCRATRHRPSPTERRSPRRSVTSPTPRAGSCSAMVGFCRPTMRRSPSMRARRSSWPQP